MKRAALLLMALALVGAACDRDAREDASPTPRAVASPRPVVEEPPAPGLPPVPRQRLVEGSTARAMARLCVPPEPLDRPDVEAGGADRAVAEVEEQVAELRGLDWLRPVVTTPIDDREMDRLIEEAFASQFPRGQYDRRTLAWRAIGVIEPEESLYEALLSYGTGQVVGFYDPQHGELVYLGRDEEELHLAEKAIVAHELVHAIDDQHFDLRRIDTLAAGCRDEEVAAGLGVVEGSAQHFSIQVILRYPAPVGGELLDEILRGANRGDVPAFVANLQVAPYREGPAFVAAIAEAHGPDAIDEALRRWPPTTEQILHPERWPDDRPTPVDVPDVGRRLGDGWTEIDVMQVGELWLRELLRLRLDDAVADAAAAGWDGGAYRAWERDGEVVVALRTAWDSSGDAHAFADAMDRWLDGGSSLGEVIPLRRSIVDVVVATDASALASIVGPVPVA
jgi:hypothetical protein